MQALWRNILGYICIHKLIYVNMFIKHSVYQISGLDSVVFVGCWGGGERGEELVSHMIGIFLFAGS